MPWKRNEDTVKLEASQKTKEALAPKNPDSSVHAHRAWPRAAYSRSARAGRGPENPDFVGAGAPDVPRAADSRNGRAARVPENPGFLRRVLRW